MLSLQTIANKARAVQDAQMDPEDFQEWFSDFAFGHRGARGNQVADALAAIDMVLTEMSLGEFEGAELGARLLDAIAPFSRPEFRVQCKIAPLGEYPEPIARLSPQSLGIRLGSSSQPIAGMIAASERRSKIHRGPVPTHESIDGRAIPYFTNPSQVPAA